MENKRFFFHHFMIKIGLSCNSCLTNSLKDVNMHWKTIAFFFFYYVDICRRRRTFYNDMSKERMPAATALIMNGKLNIIIVFMLALFSTVSFLLQSGITTISTKRSNSRCKESCRYGSCCWVRRLVSVLHSQKSILYTLWSIFWKELDQV